MPDERTGMDVKLIMTWDIRAGRDQEYFEFLVRDWISPAPRTSACATPAPG